LSRLKPTPYVLVGQHDNFFVKDVNYLPEMLECMQQKEYSWLQCLHFPSTATLNYVEKIERRYQLDLEPFCRKYSVASTNGRFIPLVFWYGRTQIARWEYYTKRILVKYPLCCGDHLEEIWGTRQLKDLMELKKNNDVDKFRASFREVHTGYGNYVFFESTDGCDDESNQQEVLYHLSGRKARAVSSSSSDVSDLIKCDGGVTKAAYSVPKHSAFAPHGNSFTTARRATAVVPGLELNAATSTSDNKKIKPPLGKFKQRCFRCGEKGHSFKYCPTFAEDEESKLPEMEVLNLT
jgi:hypothetical protein